jgi:ketosteroid isomerase-like protein
VSGTGARPSATRALVESYFAAEMRRDVNGVLEHFHDDAVLQPPDGRRLEGGAIRSFYDGVLESISELEVRIVSEVADGELGAIEWEAEICDADGERRSIRGVNVVRIRGDRFVRLATYFGPTSG